VTRVRRRVYPALLLLSIGLLALAAGCLGTTTGGDDYPAWNLTLIGDTEIVLSLDEIRAMDAVEGYGYAVSTVGIRYGPNRYRGVLLTDLLDMVGGVGEDDLVYVSAPDGYMWVFDGVQVRGEDLFTFDENLHEIPSPPLQVILAYDCDGKPLAYDNGGPLRLVVISETPDVITEGSPWVKWVEKIEVKRR